MPLPGNLDELREKLARSLEAQGADVNALDAGSNHPYSCRCETCWKWWKTMGLGDEDDAPFTQLELDQDTYEAAQKVYPQVGGLGPLELTEMILNLAREQRKADPCKFGDHDWVKDADFEGSTGTYHCSRCSKVFP